MSRYDGLTGYEKTKPMLQDAARAVDRGQLAEAHTLVTTSGGSMMDFQNILGRARLKKMRAWMRAGRPA